MYVAQIKEKKNIVQNNSYNPLFCIKFIHIDKMFIIFYYLHKYFNIQE